jgi:5-methyltetrahydropteroyltriglutamate--homocysteine methyltransferase
MRVEYKTITTLVWWCSSTMPRRGELRPHGVPPRACRIRAWLARQVEVNNTRSQGRASAYAHVAVLVRTSDAVQDIADHPGVRAGAYSIELANPRHEHEWRLWEHLKLPDDAILIPGVISHATNIVEHPELVAERIVRLARLVSRENVIASTDCGFAQVTYFARVHPSIMWAKLETLVAGARLATAELW